MKDLSALRLVILLTTSSLSVVTNSFAGVESSGGAESHPGTAPWFSASYQKHLKVRTCSVVSPDFGMTKAEAEPEIARVFKKWDQYLRKKRKIVPLNAEQEKNAASFNLGGLRMEVETLPTCDGSEDLKVYFGAKDALVLSGLAKHDKPYGFTQIIQTDSDGWSRGYIYVALPREFGLGDTGWNWKETYHLEALLLHEVGHILGYGHVSETIMSAELSEQLKYGNMLDDHPYLTHIDWQRELAACVECGAIYPGILDRQHYGPIDHQKVFDGTERAFQLLAGKPSSGIRSVRFDKKAKSTDSKLDDEMLIDGNLVFTDAKGEHAFPLHSRLILSMDYFNAVWGMGNSDGYTYFSQIKTASGKEHSVFVNFNSNGAAFQILDSAGHKFPDVIFRSNWAYGL